MGIIFIDSFDHYTTLPGKWDSYLGSGIHIGATDGRNGTAGLHKASDRDNEGVLKSLGMDALYSVVGFALKVGDGSAISYVCMFYDGGGTEILNLQLQATTKLLSAYRGTTLLYTSSWAPSYGVWHYLELKAKFNSSTGYVVVKVDGAEVINQTGLNTSATNVAKSFALSRVNAIGGNGFDTCYDDLYLCANTDESDDFYGDCRVECPALTGDGNYSQLTPSGSGLNSEMVDERPPNTGDYVHGNSPGLIDTYTKAALQSTAGTVHAVAVNMYLQKDNAGSKQAAGIARLSGTDLAGAGIAVPSSWGFVQQMLSKPGGGSWSIADVNNAELGSKIIV